MMKADSILVKISKWDREELWNHDKDILAVIRGLENWRHLLEGVKIQVWGLDRL